MLAVTSVNDCRYCNWGHTALALRNSVDLTALRQTLDSGSLSADSTLARLRRVPVEGGHPAGEAIGPGRFPGAPVSLGVEPHAGIRGDRLAISSSRHSPRQPE